MTRAYRADPLTETRLIRDATDALRQIPELRNAGLGERRQIAAHAVRALFSVERQDPEGTK